MVSAWRYWGPLVAALLSFGFVQAGHAQSSDGLVGTWRYASFAMKYVAGGEPPSQAGGPYGAGASGYFTLDTSGQFIMAIIGDRPKFNARNRREGNAEEFAGPGPARGNFLFG